jgi:protein SCO1/2
MRLRVRNVLLALAAGTLFGVGAAAIVSTRLDASRAPDVPGLLWPDPKQVQPFALTDQHGAPFGVERFDKRWTFLFFGYTYCPDVCPTTLSMLAKVQQDLARDGSGSDVQVVFVSVDPTRDTPQHLGAYVSFFNPDFVALTGPDDGLARLTRQLGIYFSRDAPDGDGNYLVGHSSAVLLIDPQRRLVAIHQAPHDAAQIAQSFRQVRRFLEG